MKIIRQNYPKIRVYVKKGHPYFQVDLRRKVYTGTKKFFSFSTEKEARDFARKFEADIPKLRSIEETAAEKLGRWSGQAALYRLTVDQIFELGLREAEKQLATLESPFMAGLITSWVDDKTSNKLKPLRERSKKSIRHMGNMFKEDFGMARMKEIDQERIEKYLKEKDVSNQSRKNIRSYLGQFFNWAISKGYHSENPTEKIEIAVEMGVPEFFTVDQCVTIMERAKAQPKITSYFALCLFGGIRPEECSLLTWKNVKLETKEIDIPASISKTKKPRLFTMSDNLHAWLTLGKDIPLIPANIRKLKDSVMNDLGFDWIADGLRHTFATFHYAKHHHLEELRHVMGNSPGVIERFYKGVIPKAEVEKFWGILPSEIQKTATNNQPTIDLSNEPSVTEEK